MDRARLEQYLKEGLSLAEVARRHGLDSSTVGKMAKRYGLEPPGRVVYAEKPIDPEELRRLVESEATLRELAEYFGVTITTVRKHLRRHELRTARAGDRAERRAVRLSGPTRCSMVCRRHGEAPFQLEGRGYYRCTACRAEAVQRRRRKVKAILVAEAGGACAICAYDRCVRALHFHHRDPAAKAFGLGGHGYTHGIEALRLEARKCILLCSNCHAEVESGVAELAA